MNTLWLRIQAPFAAFRWLQAGVYRATSPVIPPSAAWGLVLNLAHIETRASSRGDTTTRIRAGAPPLCLAIGQVSSCNVATIYQQLHSYPVGSSGKNLARRTHGAKYWIAPLRRELLAGFDCILGVRTRSPELCQRVTAGLSGTLDQPRYGLPFAGDNNLLIDRIDVLDTPCPARWYTRVRTGDPPPRRSCRLTVAIDRADSSQTRSALFAPSALASEPPERAWTWCPRPPQ